MDAEPAPPLPAEPGGFSVDVDGFEGPLDLLLELARRQKVDLARISVLALAEQYLAFVEAARADRLELAADYLVIAAWLAYLKSRLLVPEPEASADEPPAALLAAALAFRLRRLDAMRRAAERLVDRALLGRDRHARGMGEAEVPSAPRLQASLYDLLAAFAAHHARRSLSQVTIRPRAVWDLAEARSTLERLLGATLAWVPLDGFLARYAPAGLDRAAAVAAGLSATLELVREGRLEMHQDTAFAPLLVRGRADRQGDLLHG